MLPRGLGIFAATALLSAPVVAGAQTSPSIAVSRSSVDPGGVFHVEVRGSGDDRMALRFLDQIIPLDFDAGRSIWDGLVGIDLDVKPGTYTLAVLARDRPHGSQAVTVVPKTFRTRRLSVAPDYVNPPPDTLARIESEAKKLAAVFDARTARKYSGAFLTPVDGAPTSNFGTRSVYNGSPRSPHAGVDFSGGVGTPIRAANHGLVVLAEPLYFTGNTVVIDYGSGLIGLFAHMSELRVAQGDRVAPDTIVGLIGATGRVTGPHLHWSIRLHGARVDPTQLLAVNNRVINTGAQ